MYGDQIPLAFSTKQDWVEEAEKWGGIVPAGWVPWLAASGAVILAVTLHKLWLVYPPAEVSKAAFPSDPHPWYCLEVGSINFFLLSFCKQQSGLLI